MYLHRRASIVFLTFSYLALPPSAARAGFITGNLNIGAAVDANLTIQGNEDWAIWGYADGGTSTSLAPDVSKLTGNGISNLTNISNGNPLRGIGQFGGFSHTFDWSDGNSIPTATGALGGIQHDGEQPPQASNIGEGFSFTVPADKTMRTLTVYVTAHLGVGTLLATLSDSSGRMFIESINGSTTNNESGVFTIAYEADAPGQTLNVTYVLSAENEFVLNSANAAIYAVALSVPEPPGMILVVFGIVALVASALPKRPQSRSTSAS